MMGSGGIGMQSFEVMKKSNWDFRKRFFIMKKADFSGRFLQAKATKKLSNFKRNIKKWHPIRPVRFYEFDRERLTTYDDFFIWMEEKIAPSLSDGWYALVGYGYKTRRCFSKNRGVRDFRWLYMFRVAERHIVEIQKRSKGHKSGRKWRRKPSEKNRPARYFAVIQYYGLQNKLKGQYFR